MTKQAGYDYFMSLALKYGWGVQKGLIVMWSGSIATIPSGWVFCDGTNETPDLRSRFIVCAQEDHNNCQTIYWEGKWTYQGGAAEHTHTDSGHTHTDNGHTHTGITGDDGEGYWPSGLQEYGCSQHSHTHTFTTDSGVSDIGNASASISTTNHMPPFFALAFIMKT